MEDAIADPERGVAAAAPALAGVHVEVVDVAGGGGGAGRQEREQSGRQPGHSKQHQAADARVTPRRRSAMPGTDWAHNGRWATTAPDSMRDGVEDWPIGWMAS